MGLWRITEKGPKPVPETKLKQEDLFEEHLEDWICSDGSILGEPLFIIGRQVEIPDMKGRLDILAIDMHGNAVIIKLKRSKLKDPVDIQALRYASYISKWRFTDFDNVARHYLNEANDPGFNFNALLEFFCKGDGQGEVPDINTDQRIIIVGSSVRDKLVGSVAFWLFERTINIKVIEVRAFKDSSNMFVELNTVVPLRMNKFSDSEKLKSDGSPSLNDIQSWHLKKRCSPVTREMFLNWIKSS